MEAEQQTTKQAQQIRQLKNKIWKNKRQITLTPSKAQIQKQKKSSQKQLKIQFRPQIVSLLNHQYFTTQFPLQTFSFLTLLNIAQKSLKEKHIRIKYQLPYSAIIKYSIKLEISDIFPFTQKQHNSLIKLADLCQKAITTANYTIVSQLNAYILSEKQCLNQEQLAQQYRSFYPRFKYISIKQAMIFTGLSQCRIWQTICKQRKKSGKQFDLDPIINFFNQIAEKWELINPFHVSILPKKHVKHMQKKIIQKKSQNILFQAVSNKNIPKIKQILLNGFDIQFPAYVQDRQHNREMRVSHKACAMGDLELCKLLHSYGANWEAQDDQKMSPIFYAILADSLQIVKFLVQEIGVNIQKKQIQNRTPFYWACTQGQFQIIKYLADKGADINHKSSLGRTALTKSCYLGRTDIVKYLISLPNIDIVSKDKKGRTALHNATFGSKGGRQGHKFGTNQKDSPQCAQILLQNKFPIDQRDFQNNTALHIAMSSDAIDSVRLLVAFGSSLSARNDYGETPLLTGCKFGHNDSVTILVEEFNDDITVKDIFNKNVALLTAKFKQQGQMNSVYTLLLEKFLLQLTKKGDYDEIFRTMKEMIAEKYSPQLKIFIQKCEKLKIKYEEFKYEFNDIKKVLQLPLEDKQLISYLLKKIQNHIGQQNIFLFFKNVFEYNDVKLIEFIYQNCKELLDKGIQMIDPFYIIGKIDIFKQKMVTFCLLTMDFDWLQFRDQFSSNIFHYLVRSKKIGPLIQILKAFSGINTPVLKNKYIKEKSQQELKKILTKLLTEQDSQGFDPYQFSKVIKEPTIIKILQQKIKQNNLQVHQKSNWDVKQYKVILQDDEQELKKFNTYQLQTELNNLCQKIQQSTQKQFLQPLFQTVGDPTQAWQKFNQRKFYYCKDSQSLQNIPKLYKEHLVGIDIQYFYQQGYILMSTLQFSSPKEDYLIDCLSSDLDLKTIAGVVKPLLDNPYILKIMHGSDNDLVLLKSNLNLSVVNFLDTARLDLQLIKKNNLRGLGTICSQYLKIIMPKEHQVSQWRIRPLPKAMMFYARRDSMILPYLAVEMLTKIPNQNLKQILVNASKGAKKNKKTSQPLIKSIAAIN